MKRFVWLNVLVLLILMSTEVYGQKSDKNAEELKVILIRHGEKPEKGGNLTCRGLNRSLQLPTVIHAKFGVPDFTYVPTLKMGDKTSHSRMFETVVPLAVKYNLVINSKIDEKDTMGLATEIKAQKGTVLVVWEHSAIAGIVHALGVTEEVKWPGSDFDSIWIITYKDGKAILTKDNEGLNPSEDCP